MREGTGPGPEEESPSFLSRAWTGVNVRFWRAVDSCGAPREGGWRVHMGPPRAGLGFWRIGLEETGQPSNDPVLRVRVEGRVEGVVDPRRLDRERLMDFQDVVAKALVGARRRGVFVDARQEEQFIVLMSPGVQGPQKFRRQRLAPVRWLDRDVVGHRDVFAEGFSYIGVG